MVLTSTSVEYLHFAINLAILILCVAPFGGYMRRVYTGLPTFLSPLLSGFESQLYRLAGIDPRQGMSWQAYAISALVFSGVGFACLYLFLIFQTPGAGSNDPALSPALAFNLAAGFVGESGAYTHVHAVSPLNQMVGLTVQNFLSTAVSLSVFIAVTRGMARSTPGLIGNFWVDLVRSIFYVLLPLSLAYVFLIATAGVGDAIEAYAIANLAHPSASHSLDGLAALQTAKLTITTSGSFLNASSAALADVTTPMTKLLAFLSHWLIPTALCWTFGEMIMDKRQGYFILAGAALLLVLSVAATGWVADGVNESLIRLIGGNGAVLYGLVAVLALTVIIRRWILRQSPKYLGHDVRYFDITMALTTLLVPTIVMAVLLVVRELKASTGDLSPLIESVWGLGALISRFWIMIPALAIAGSFTATPTFLQGPAK